MLCTVLGCFSRVQFFATLWTVAVEAALYMGFSRQEYWSYCHVLLPNPRIESAYLKSPTLAGRFFTTSTTWKALVIMYIMITSYVYILQNDHRAKPSSHPSDSLAATKLLQSCPTLCDPIDGSPPGSPIPGSLQARTPEWVAISFSNAWKWKVKMKLLSRVRLLVTPWTAAYQAPPSMGFARQEYWSGERLLARFKCTIGHY